MENYKLIIIGQGELENKYYKTIKDKKLENRIEISFVVNEKKSNDVIRITFEKRCYNKKILTTG